MNRCFTFTLGYREDIPLRRLHEYTASRKDEVILLTQHPTPLHTRKAIESLELITAKLALPQPQIIELPPTIPEASSKLAKIYKQRKHMLHVVDLSQGPRSLTLAAYTVIIALQLEAIIHVEAEQEEAWHTIIPSEVIAQLTRKLPPTQQQLLRTILETPGLTPPELASILKRNEKTIRNYVAQLKKKHLLTTKHGKIYPTPWTTLFT